MEEKAVISSNNEYILNQAKAILKENGITYIEKTEGAGDINRITRGRTANMTTIYVNKEQIDVASSLIDEIVKLNENDEDMSDIIPDELKELDEDKGYEEKYKKRIKTIRRIFSYGLCGIIILMIIILLIYNKY